MAFYLKKKNRPKELKWLYNEQNSQFSHSNLVVHTKSLNFQRSFYLVYIFGCIVSNKFNFGLHSVCHKPAIDNVPYKGQNVWDF